MTNNMKQGIEELYHVYGDYNSLANGSLKKGMDGYEDALDRLSSYTQVSKGELDRGMGFDTALA